MDSEAINDAIGAQVLIIKDYENPTMKFDIAGLETLADMTRITTIQGIQTIVSLSATY